MKNSKLKLLLSAAAVCATLGAVGCSKSDKVTIGILQPIEHDALAAAKDGFMKAVRENGYEGKVTFKYQNANGVEADLNTLAKSLTATCDLTLGIGTGASVALQAAHVNAGSTKPLLFTAVTDPVSAGLVENADAPEGFITGTSDANPVEAQIDLIKDCIPTVDSIGILYTQSETNSEVQADQAEKEAKSQGLTVTRRTCTDTSDLPQVVNELVNVDGLDAIYIPTDNLIAANMNTVKEAVNEKHILTVCGEENMMASGGHVTLSVSYTELGIRTGKMAAAILKGEKTVAQSPVTTMSKDECTYMMCQDNLNAASITLPAEILAKCTNIEAK